MPDRAGRSRAHPAQRGAQHPADQRQRVDPLLLLRRRRRGRGRGRLHLELAVAAAADADGWSADDAALLRAADELQADSTVSDATWETLAARYEAGGLVEIPFVVGQYTMLSMLANAAGVEVEPGYERLPGGGN